MKKKIAVITLTGYFNFGNRLQNYALQQILSSYGFLVDTIKINKRITPTNTRKNKNILTKLKKIRTKTITELFNIAILKTFGIYKKKRLSSSNEIRTSSFKEFVKKYINETDYSISNNNLPEDFVEKYDYFIVGSDQVWNPNFNLDMPIYFLFFVPRNKRLTFAPSFGITEIPEKYIKVFQEGLSGFDKLSVREKSGAEIIYQLTGKKAKVLMDPTLMLTKEDWLEIAIEPQKEIKENYVLTYLLGKIPKENRKIIKKIAKKNNFQIINLASTHDLKNYTIGPGEFISYINSSSIVFTDSFHGAIFSILFDKPFVICENECHSRRTMETRFDTLLSTFRLESRKIGNLKSDEDFLNIDYTHIPSILKAEKEKASKYLKGILAINNIINS